MPVVTAVSASPTWPNPGMASVDLALCSLFRRHRIPAELRFARLYAPAACRASLPPPWRRRLERMERLPIRYGQLRPRLARSAPGAAILYWGDFFHSRDYLNRIAALLCQIGDAASPAAALADVHRHFYLRDAPDSVLGSAMAFGGTLIFNRARDYLNRDYRESLVHFVCGARRLWMRDLHSAARVAQLRQRRGETSLGVDAALLLRDEDLEALPRSAWSRRIATAPSRAGIFFGRTHADAALLGRFAGRICKELRTAGEWLPWFDPGVLPNHLAACRASFPSLIVHSHPPPPGIGDLLGRLSSYAFVVSDTYHLCVNAWRAGVPALCIGAATPNPQGFDVSTGWFGAWRDKRYDFYAMHDAMEYYIFSEELAHRRGFANRVLQAMELLRDRALTGAIAADMRARTEAAESELVAELCQLVGAPGAAA